MQLGIQQTTWCAPLQNRSRKLPVFKPGKWSINAHRKIALYGHNAKNMKNFTLHCDNEDQRDSLNPPPDYGLEKPELCFSRSQVRDPAYALLDSGATHVLLLGHMLPIGAHSFEVTVNLAVGKEKARCWRDEVYAEDRAHPLLPLGRLANLLDTKLTWENG